MTTNPLPARVPPWTSKESEANVNRWRRILALGQAQPYDAGAIIFRQDSRPNELFLLEKGLVKLARVFPNGDEVILCLRYPGQLVDGASSLLGVPHSFSATAAVACDVLRFSAARFANDLHRNAEAAELLLRQLAEDSHQWADELSVRKVDSAELRLWRLVDQLASFAGVAEIVGPVRIPWPLRSYEVAELVGVSRQYFSKLMRRFEAGGLLRQEDDSLVVIRRRDPASDTLP